MDGDSDQKNLAERFKELTAEASNNEAILRRSQHRELELLTAESLKELLSRLVHGMCDSFGLNTVTLMLCDPEHEIQHILAGNGIDLEDVPGVLFVDNPVGLTPLYNTMRKPWLGPYMGADHQLLFPGATGLKSIALLPLMRKDKLAGSLNLGSDDATRFTRHHATDFLAHLSVIAAFCLENAVNRERLLRAGLTDVLTGWHNRRYLQSRLSEEVVHSRRYNEPLVCLLIDVDEFKSINDTHGHLTGDNLLREVANRIKGQIRGSDVAARFGGDEFAVLLPHTRLDEGIQLAERILGAVTEKPVLSDQGDDIRVTLSIGVAEDTPGQDVFDTAKIAENLLADADMALYKAKSDGRNCVRTAGSD